MSLPRSILAAGHPFVEFNCGCRGILLVPEKESNNRNAIIIFKCDDDNTCPDFSIREMGEEEFTPLDSFAAEKLVDWVANGLGDSERFRRIKKALSNEA